MTTASTTWVIVFGLAALALIVVAPAVIRRRARSISPGSEDIFPSGDAGKDEPSADQILIESARRLLDAQVSSNDVLDGRIAGSFGVGSTVLPVTVGLLNLVQDGASLPDATKWLVGIALAAYVVLIVAALVSFWVRNLEFRPNLERLRDNVAAGYSGAEMRRWVAEEYILAVELNRRRLVRKSRAAIFVVTALYAEALLLSAAALVTVW